MAFLVATQQLSDLDTRTRALLRNATQPLFLAQNAKRGRLGRRRRGGEVHVLGRVDDLLLVEGRVLDPRGRPQWDEAVVRTGVVLRVGCRDSPSAARPGVQL